MRRKYRVPQSTEVCSCSCQSSSFVINDPLLSFQENHVSLVPVAAMATLVPSSRDVITFARENANLLEVRLSSGAIG